jgi:hypothetical protein
MSLCTATALHMRVLTIPQSSGVLVADVPSMLRAACCVPYGRCSRRLSRFVPVNVVAAGMPGCLWQVLGSTLGRYDGNVYEALYAGATRSKLNHTQPFKGYAEFLRPELDIDMLRLRNGLLPEAKL